MREDPRLGNAKWVRSKAWVGVGPTRPEDCRDQEDLLDGARLSRRLAIGTGDTRRVVVLFGVAR